MEQDPDRSELIWLGAAQERAACAELVRAAGCICQNVLGAEKAYERGEDGLYHFVVKEHVEQCPQALAAAIEARGR